MPGKRAYPVPRARTNHEKFCALFLARDEREDLASKPANRVGIGEVAQVAGEDDRVRIARAAGPRATAEIDAAAIDGEIGKIADRCAVDRRHDRRVIPGAANFALVAQQAARFQAGGNSQRRPFVVASALEVERQCVDEIDHSRERRRVLDAPRHPRELDVDQVVTFFGEQPPDGATHRAGFMHRGLHRASRRQPTAKACDHSRRAMRYHDRIFAQRCRSRVICRRTFAVAEADQSHAMAAAEQPKLMISPKLVAAQRRLRRFRCDEKNSHRVSSTRTRGRSVIHPSPRCRSSARLVPPARALGCGAFAGSAFRRHAQLQHSSSVRPANPMRAEALFEIWRFPLAQR